MVYIDSIRLRPDTLRAVTSGYDRLPKCDCGQTCTAAVDAQGLFFWVCAPKTCCHVVIMDPQPKAAMLDLGLFTPFGSSVIDRYTTLSHVMGGFGKVFTKSFWEDLRGRDPDAEWPDGSFPMEEGGEYDYFISYRGGSGWFFLFFTQICLNNMLPVVIFSYGFCIVLTLFLRLITDA